MQPLDANAKYFRNQGVARMGKYVHNGAHRTQRGIKNLNVFNELE